MNIFVTKVFYLCQGKQSIYFYEKSFIFVVGFNKPECNGTGKADSMRQRDSG